MEFSFVTSNDNLIFPLKRWVFFKDVVDDIPKAPFLFSKMYFKFISPIAMFDCKY